MFGIFFSNFIIDIYFFFTFQFVLYLILREVWQQILMFWWQMSMYYTSQLNSTAMHQSRLLYYFTALY